MDADYERSLKRLKERALQRRRANYKNMKVAELRQLAEARGIEDFRDLRKAELIAALERSESNE